MFLKNPQKVSVTEGPLQCGSLRGTLSNSKAGFTLVEVIIYIALITFVIGAGVGSAFYLIDNSDRDNAKTNTLIEAEFLLRKIDWALTGVETIGVPVSGSSGSNLNLKKEDVGWIDIDTSGSRVKYQGEFITSERVKISGLNFIHKPAIGSKPESIEASFTADGKPFELVKYLRK